jgi:integrase
MTRKVLTDKAVLALKPAAAGKRYVVNDALVPGFGVRVTDRGHRTYVLGGRYPGSKNYVVRELGEVGALSLADAREQARQWLAALKAGNDPRELARQQRLAAARAAGNTFAALAADYIAIGLRGKRQIVNVKYRLDREVLPVLGHRPLAAITRAEVVELIQKIADRPAPAFARNVLDAIRGCFNFAVARPRYGIDTSPCDRIKPKALIGAKQIRERVLDNDELRAVWRAASRARYPYGDMVKLLLLTGCRVNEVALARWHEFDAELWTIPAERFKSGSQHRVPLTPAMGELLASLPRWAESDYLFTLNGRKPFNGFSTSKRRLDRRALLAYRALRGDKHATMPPWILHDLRRTVRTRLAELNVRENVAELVIGHSKKGLARIYDQHRYADEMRAALQAWGNLLASIVGQSPANVVEFRKAL